MRGTAWKTKRVETECAITVDDLMGAISSAWLGTQEVVIQLVELSYLHDCHISGSFLA